MTNKNEKRIEKFSELFDNNNKFIVPTYQRAYAWEEKQLKQFISDLIEIKNKDYYYGHFILERSPNGEFEVIDGQQRLTTFILFLMVCNLFCDNKYQCYYSKFETVDYDKEALNQIQKKLKDKKNDWNLSDFEISEENQTLSIKRILFALNFIKKSINNKLEKNNIEGYVNTFFNAHISTHITTDKAVAVQIFELQNTRGIGLDLIEKVKAKLMKEIYLNVESDYEESIREIQSNFSEIYKWEENINTNNFRGDLNLDDILFHHLRIVDDGSKLSTKVKSTFDTPSTSGNKEEIVLTYLDNQLQNKKNIKIKEYIINLVKKFKETVCFFSEKIIHYDQENRLIGDVLILEKDKSVEFIILLLHKGFEEGFKSEEIFKLWEKLLFTRDFHDKYYGKQYRDDFEELYLKIASVKNTEKAKSILNDYVKDGFRKEIMEDGDLQKTVANYIYENEIKILNNAFNWWQSKMVYVLYKYEIAALANLNELRNIMKKGKSIEHILPIQWEWSWIGEYDSSKISNEGKEFNKEIENIINGLGNLLLITGSENSSNSNYHPNLKEYQSCSGGSYKEHNSSKEKWEDHKNWKEIILKRGEKILSYLKEYFSL